LIVELCADADEVKLMRATLSNPIEDSRGKVVRAFDEINTRLLLQENIKIIVGNRVLRVDDISDRRRLSLGN